MKVKSASLDTIARAVGKPTGDDLRKQRRDEEYQEMISFRDSLPKYMNSRQRRALKRILEKQEKSS